MDYAVIASSECKTSITLDEVKRVQRTTRNMQTIYRDFGICLYDLATSVRSQLAANIENNIAKCYCVTSEQPIPPIVLILDIVSQCLDDVPDLLQHGRDGMAVHSLTEAKTKIQELYLELRDVFATIVRATRQGRRDLDSDLQQARAGLVPDALLAWCRTLREVRVAIDLGAIEDDPHQILAYVVEEEERLSESVTPAKCNAEHVEAFLTIFTDLDRQERLFGSIEQS